MKIRSVLLSAALVTAALLIVAPVPAGSIPLHPVGRVSIAGEDWLRGELSNLVVGQAGLLLGGDGSFVREGRAFGIFVSPVLLAEAHFDLVRARLMQDERAPGLVELAARSSIDGARWSAWWPLPVDGSSASLPVGRFLQYRLEVEAGKAETPAIRSIDAELASTGALPVPADGENPTVRVFGSREGLVGRRTANGHLIVPKDRFAALPSKRVLNPDGKQDYQVRIAYKDRSVTVPIWDVGPWNTRDNYWDETREMFGDLPRFVPQALAAWRDDHNSGRDQFNRWVTFPASIDIADGAFIDDLGMRNSDWVDVSFLWLTAPSPPRAELPVVSGLKPEPKAPGPPPDGQVWYFAEGNTNPPFETIFLLHNPNPDPAKANFTYMRVDGSVQRQEVTLNASASARVRANDSLPNAEFSTRIEATRAIVAERLVLFGADGHSSVGARAPATSWFLAEGATQPPFDSWILLQNPGSTAASVTLTFMKDGGENEVANVSLSPTSRRSVHLNTLVPNSAFSTRVGSDQPIVVERTSYLARGGGHGALGATTASKTWYLAEGSTQPGFDTWLLIMNPGRSPAKAQVTYLRPGGKPVEQRVTVGATSRLALNARDQVQGEQFGLAVEADHGVVVERAMYFGGAPDGAGTGAHATVAAPELSKSWSLVGLPARPPFDQQIAVVNPGGSPARVRAEFRLEDGSAVSRVFSVAVASRKSIDPESEAPPGWVAVDVSADEPIVVERSAYFSDGAGGVSSIATPR